MDLSQLSTDDLKALQGGDLTQVSSAGLKAMQGTAAGPAVAPASSYWDQVRGNMIGTGQAFNQLASGALRGAGSIGTTLIRPFESKQVNDERKASLDAFFKDNTDPTSVAFGTGKLGAEVAGTAGVGGVLGAGAKVLGASAPIVSSLTSAGFSAGKAAPGLVGFAANQAARIGGGAVTGGASATLVDPDTALTGAAIGAVLPPVLAAMGKTGGTVTDIWRRMVGSGNAAGAQSLLRALEASTPEQQQAIALQLQNARTLVPGASPTVAQALQTPQASITQRVVHDSPGGAPLRNKLVAQNEARVSALESVAPTDPTGAAMARENLGQGVSRAVIPERAAAMDNVRKLYDAVDPTDAVRLQLPLDEMQAARDKFLGPGTFGQGQGTEQALKTAQSIGTDGTDSVITKWKRLAEGNGRGDQASIGTAVRSLGIHPSEVQGAGVTGYAGEVRYLKEGPFGKGLVNKNGRTLESMAERMHSDGYLDQPDVGELLGKLTEEAAGTPSFSRYVDPQMAMARSMNLDAPAKHITPGTSNPVAVNWPTLQNFSSAVGDAAETASAKGANRDAASLQAIRAQLMGRIDQAGGQGLLKPGESFPLDAYARWTDANAAHAARMDRFDSGPFAGVFRSSPNGEPALQGGEIAARAWGARPGLANDVQAFRKLVDDKPALMGQFRSLITTEGAGTSDAAGNLTTKFSKWVDNTLPGLKEAFAPDEVTTLRRIAQDIDRNASATKLGTSLGGSNTYQNSANALSLGLIDNPLVSKTAGAIPLFGKVFEGMKDSARNAKAKQLAGLLADSDLSARAIQGLLGSRSTGLGLLGSSALRALPVAGSQ